MIDHIWPSLKSKQGVFEPWASQMREIAGYPKIYCKLSGLVTEADHRGVEAGGLYGLRRGIFWMIFSAAGLCTAAIGRCACWPELRAGYGLSGKVLPDSLTEAEREAHLRGQCRGISISSGSGIK